MRGKRGFILSFVVLLLLALWMQSVYGADSNEQQLKSKLAELRRQQNDVKSKSEEIVNKLEQNKSTQKKLKDEIYYLDLKMNDLEEKIANLQKEIDATEKKAEQAAKELDQAIARVNERDRLLKTRIKAIYTTGNVSYLEVLLDSSSLGDFLTRLDMVEKIVASDKAILEKNKKDQEMIAERKKEIEGFLADLSKKYAEQQKQKNELASLSKQRSVQIASLQEQAEEFELEQEKLNAQLLAIAKQITQVNNELTRLKWAGGKLAWPVPDSHNITSPFGYRIHPIKKVRSLHAGIDIAAPQGTDIVAVDKGRVIMAEYYGAYGNTIMIDHGSGLVTQYSHIRNGGMNVKVNQMVDRGEKIAEVGSTGLSTGPHLHFGVIRNGEYTNPMNYFKK